MNKVKEKSYIFILGVSQRCGTNFLMKLLEKNEKINKANHPGEDFIVYSSEYLANYFNVLKKNWSNSWKGMETNERIEVHKKYIRNSILEYLMACEDLDDGEFCVTKTPSVKNIDIFFDMFPNSKLIILMRNGKNIVESGVKGFKWKYYKAMKNHKINATLIKNFLSKNENNPNVVFVKYEDLILDKKNTLNSLFKQFNIDDCKYNYKEEIPIYGSSFIRKENKITWEPQMPKDSFNPLIRTEKWSLLRRVQYYFICGKIHKYFGYS